MQFIKTHMNVKNSFRYALERIGQIRRLGNIFDSPTGDKDLNRILNEDSNSEEYWDNEIPFDYSPAALREMEQKYELSNSTRTKGALAFKIAMSYHLGKTGCQSHAIDIDKEKKWFVNSLQYQNGSAYWLAACVSKTDSDKITDNFTSLKLAMNENGYATDKKAADHYAVIAALSGHGQASAMLRRAVDYPDQVLSKGMLAILKEMQIEPSKELQDELLVNGALAGLPYDCMRLRHRLLKKNIDQKYLADSLNKKHDIQLTDNYVDNLLVTAALGGHPTANWNLYQILSNNKNEISSQEISDLVAEATDYKNIEDVKTDFLVSAGLGGNVNASWMIMLAITHPQDKRSQNVLKTLKEQNIEITETLINDLKIISALSGNVDAGMHMAWAILVPEDPKAVSLVQELKKRNIAPTSKLAAQLQLKAAFAGQPKAAWMLASALFDKKYAPYPHLTEEIKDQHLLLPPIVSDQLKFIAALGRNEKAIDYCTKSAFQSNEGYRARFIFAVEKLGVEMDTSLQATFLANSSEVLKKDISKLYTTNQLNLLKSAQLLPNELEQRRAIAIKNFKGSHLKDFNQYDNFDIEYNYIN